MALILSYFGPELAMFSGQSVYILGPLQIAKIIDLGLAKGAGEPGTESAISTPGDLLEHQNSPVQSSWRALLPGWFDGSGRT